IVRRQSAAFRFVGTAQVGRDPIRSASRQKKRQTRQNDRTRLPREGPLSINASAKRSRTTKTQSGHPGAFHYGLPRAGERESNRGFAGRRPMTSVAPRDEKLVFGISGGSLATIGSPSRRMCWSMSWHSTQHLRMSQHERTAY